MPEEPTQPKVNDAPDTTNNEQSNVLADIESRDVSTDATTTPSYENVSSSPEVVSAYVPPVEPKKRKTGLIVAAVVAAVLVVLGGGSAAVYAFWYQNPEKIVMDSLVNAYTAKTAAVDGTVKFETEDAIFDLAINTQGGLQNGTTMAATLKMQSVKEKNLSFEVEGESIYAQNGDVYFRAKNLKSAFDKLIDYGIEQQTKEAEEKGEKVTKEEIAQVRSFLSQMFEPTIEKVDGQWIKVAAQDLKKVNSKSAETYECIQKNVKKFYNDKKVMDQVVQVYQQNKFLIIKEQLGNKNGSLGFVIDTDEDKAKKFGESIEKLQVYKDIEACDKSNAKDSSDKSDKKAKEDKVTDSTTRTELWVDQWSHYMTSIKVNGSGGKDDKSKIAVDFKTSFNKPVTVTIPKDTMTIDELSKEIESVLPALSTVSEPSATTKA